MEMLTFFLLQCTKHSKNKKNKRLLPNIHRKIKFFFFNFCVDLLHYFVVFIKFFPLKNIQDIDVKKSSQLNSLNC
jgi:hypothetical protein